MQKQQSIIVISGPTGSGKTALAVDLAEAAAGEIINADSVQVYQGFDIGACKPSASDLSRVPHHLISALAPEQAFDAGAFVESASGLIEQLGASRKLPFVVGGTGLYIRALLCGLVDVATVSAEAEAQIASRESEFGKIAAGDEGASRRLMHGWLQELDPASAVSLHPNDMARIRRAIGVVLSFDTSLGQLQAAHAHQERPYRALVLIIEPPREELYQAINVRVDQMFELGLVEEVRALLRQYPRSARAFGSIGYSQVTRFLDGELSEDETRALIQRDTRRYAKRQFTWWRNQPKSLGWQEWPAGSLSPEYDKLVSNLSEVVELFLTPERDYATEGIAFLRVPALNRGAKST